MDNFTMMHVFFIVTTIAVGILSTLVCLAIFFLVRILRTVDKFSQLALDEATLLREDIAELRGSVRAEGMKWKSLARFVRKFFERFVGKDIKK